MGAPVTARFTRPIHMHDCPECMYVGSFEQPVEMFSEEEGFHVERVAYDGYVCLRVEQGMFVGSVIARSGPWGDYSSQPWSSTHPWRTLDEVRLMAVERGVVDHPYARCP